MQRLGLAALLALMACDAPTLNEVPAPNEPPGANTCLDGDGDGYGIGGLCLGPDCDDDDPEVNPGALDTVGDGVDNNCDGVDGTDKDGDGRPSTDSGGTRDCNDNDASVHRDAPDAVGDGVDNNCDGVDGVDADGDGHASIQSGGDDCNDLDATVSPSASDLGDNGVDENCDGVDGVDRDGDGYASLASGGTDCNDGESAVHVGATGDVAGNGVDENCDGVDGVDADGDTHASTASGGSDCRDDDASIFPGAAFLESSTACMRDADGDGWGANVPGVGITAGTDCNDDDRFAFVGAAVIEGPTQCMRDEDGDGYGSASPGPGVTAGSDCDDANAVLRVAMTAHQDADGDSFGRATVSSLCTNGTLPAGYVADSTDCNDADPFAFTGAAPADDATACMRDADGDNCGDANPGGGVTPGSDCDDTNAAVYVQVEGWLDGDGDTYGAGPVTMFCTSGALPATYVGRSGDCKDTDAYTFPGAAPRDSAADCMRDQDGDGRGDDAPGPGIIAGSDCDDTNPSLFVGINGYLDGDGDSYGAGPLTVICTDGTLPGSYVQNATDCKDTESYTHPGAAFHDSAAACMRDADGDGYGDRNPGSGVSAGTDCNDADAVHFAERLAYTDGDLDGYGAGAGVLDCTNGTLSTLAGKVLNNTDCNDTEAYTHPGAAPIDSATTCMRDQDGDDRGDRNPGSGITAGSDCDDSNGSLHTELAGYADLDGDGFGAGTPTYFCSNGVTLPTAGYVTNNTDCADNEIYTHPGAASLDSATLCMRDQDGDERGHPSPGGAVAAGTDCNDADSAVFATLTAYLDADGDGFGDAAASLVTLCTGGTLPATHAADHTDCDDTQAYTHPGAAPHDSVSACMRDFDNDGYGDETATGLVVAGTDCDDTRSTRYQTLTGYPDADGDGYGSTAAAAQDVCSGALLPSGYKATATDCDDASSSTFPGAAPHNSGTLCMKDSDNDDWGDATPGPGIQVGTDCDDSRSTTWPGAPETDNGVDDDCDGDRLELDLFDADGDGFTPLYGSLALAAPDCDDTLAFVAPGAAANDSATACMRDEDGDDYGDATPGGTTVAGTDCDDLAVVTHPGAAASDSATACMKDQDGDGFGDEAPGAGVQAGSDCDDGNAAVTPGGVENDNGIDDDCDGDALELALFDTDLDGFTPGYGSAALAVADCDDSDIKTFPGAAANDSTTLCMTDFDDDDWGDDTPAVGVTAGTDCDDGSGLIFSLVTSYLDGDGDGFGAGAGRQDCTDGTSPVGRSLTSTDCDDALVYVAPGAAPNDSATACMRDFDGDGYGSTTPGGTAVAGTDCQDLTALIFPGAAEQDDGIDENCDGDWLEADQFDRDHDRYTPGYGAEDDPIPDCDDNNPQTFPGSAPNDDPVACMKDVDDDDWGDATPGLGVTAGTDCDDASDFHHRGSVEIPDDGIDNDCMGGDRRAASNPGGAMYVDCVSGDDSNNDGSMALPYKTIRRAIIDTSKTGPVFVTGGACGGGFTLSKEVYGGYDSTDWSRDVAANRTVITGGSSGNTVSVESGYRTLQGVTIQQQGTAGSIVRLRNTGTSLSLVDVELRGLTDATANNYAVYLESGSSLQLTMHRCLVDPGASTWETIGVYSHFNLTDASINISDSTILGGSAQYSAFGLRAYRGAGVSIRRSAVEGGSGGDTFAISTCAPITIHRSVVRGGSATATATAVMLRDVSNSCDGSTASIISSAVAGGSGSSTCAVCLGYRATAHLIHDTLLAGAGTQFAHAVWSRHSSSTSLLLNSHVSSGSVSGATSAAVYNPSAGNVTLVANNLHLAQPGHCLENDGSTCITSLDTLHGCGWPGCSEAAGNISAAPQLVDVSLPDVHLRQGSPLRGLAVDPFAWYDGTLARVDVDGDPRPGAGGGDLGADELVTAFAPVISSITVDCSATGGVCYAGGIAYPLYIVVSDATSYSIEVFKTQGSGTLAQVAPAAELISSSPIAVTFTTGSGTDAVMTVWVTARGPLGEDIDSLIVNQN